MKDDTVSRAAAIETIKSHFRVDNDLLEVIVYEVAHLPAVQTCYDAVSRQAAIDALSTPHGILYPIRTVEELPSAQPQTVVRCKDCKHWKDSDGVYRRGVDAESKCPLNIQEVYAGTFYCGYAERRTDEQTD